MEAALSQPVIGVTTYRNQNPLGFSQCSLAEAYIQALALTGASPILIPLGLSQPALDAIVRRLDGILFSGGGDIEPERYGSLPHTKVDGIDIDRDQIELHLLKNVINKSMPFFGICRGLQVINVALGGSLYEDLLDQRPNTIRHQFVLGMPRDFLAHTVQIEPESRLASILQLSETKVNSLHHQGIHKVAPGLKITATAPDGVIEGIELPDYPFGLAVQWHPEWLQTNPAMQALFRAFVNAARDGNSA